MREDRLELGVAQQVERLPRQVDPPAGGPRVRGAAGLHDELGHREVGDHAQPREDLGRPVGHQAPRIVVVGEPGRDGGRAAEHEHPATSGHAHATRASRVTTATAGTTSARTTVAAVTARCGRARTAVRPTRRGSAPAAVAWKARTPIELPPTAANASPAVPRNRAAPSTSPVPTRTTSATTTSSTAVTAAFCSSSVGRAASSARRSRRGGMNPLSAPPGDRLRNRSRSRPSIGAGGPSARHGPPRS